MGIICKLWLYVKYLVKKMYLFLYFKKILKNKCYKLLKKITLINVNVLIVICRRWFFFYEVWKTETQIVDFLIINFLLHD